MKRTQKRHDIKSKLIAAICMLMVSVIMLASSSYAWFTLSTAPEVKGIQTSVGANGNLEIALLGTANSYGSPNNISSAVGDSSGAENMDPVKANTTWGNLVDLSHDSYGLGQITLMPAALNTTNWQPVVGQTIARQMLAVPMYGADGRVTRLNYDNTILAPFSNAKKAFVEVSAEKTENYDANKTIEYGLRAVGTSTNRSIRETLYATYLSQAIQTASIAKTSAVNSLSRYGAVLADIGIKGGYYDNATFTTSTLNDLQAMIDSILGYETVIYEADGETVKETLVTPGIEDEINTALLNFGMAAVASSLNTQTYESDEAFVTAMESLGNDIEAAKALLSEEAKNAFAAAAEQVMAITTKASLAQGTLNSLKNSNKETYTFSDITSVMTYLFDTATMTVCGMTVAEIRAEGGKAALMEAYGAYDNNVVVDMYGGIYSEIADLTDSFSGSAKVNVPELGEVKSVLQANRTAEVARGHLNILSTLVSGAPAPAGQSDIATISDAYGYVVDLAFRTNAANSNLLLQTAAEARVDGAESDTMGGGSSMSFSSVEGFTTEQMKKLMKKINVVFFTNDGTNTILAVAKLDADNAKTVEGKLVADLKIWDGTAFKSQANAVIYQNMPTGEAVKVSALVYLDGTSISNEDVGTGALSMSGSLNLQFSSSAQLTPMDYNAGFAPANPVVETTTAVTPAG